jgi:hypothetical protein
LRRLTFTFTLLLFAAAPPPPKFTLVPSTVLDSMCDRLRDEGLGTPVDVVRTSRPLVTRQSLQALAELGFKPQMDAALVEAAVATNATPLPLGRNAACAWNPVSDSVPRSPDTMTLEVSAPFTLPFRRGGTGVLARLSLGGESASWYWIPLVNQDGKWLAGRSVALALHE